MYDSNSKGLSYTAGFFMLIAFVVAGFIVGTIISFPVWAAMTGTSFSEMSKGLNNPAYANAFKVIQLITTVFGFFIPTLITAYLLNRKPIRLLGFNGKMKIGQVVLVVAIMIIGLFVSSGLAYFNSHLPIPTDWKQTFDRWESNYNEQVVALVGLDTFGGYLLGLLIMAVLPAICEETLFRGGLQNFLTRSTKNPFLSIIIVSILFSAVHGSYYGFLPRFFLGATLGLIYLYSGRLWLSILGHFLNNALAVTAIYVYTVQGKSIEQAMDTNTDTYWGILALPVVIALFVMFERISKKGKEEVVGLPTLNQPGDIFPS